MATKVKTGVLGTLTELNFADNGKARFGAGNDLQIYHDGSHSYIDELVTGDLRIRSNSAIALLKSSDNADMLLAVPDGAVSLYYAGAKKLETASSGVTVTGGLTVNSGHVNIDAGLSYQWDDSHERIEQSDGKIEFFTNNGEAMTLSSGNLGIGNTSPATNLHIGSGTEGENLGLKINRGSTTNFLVACDGTKQAYIGVDNTQGFMKMGSLSNHPVSISQANANAIYIDTSKNVGIGTTSPDTHLTVVGSGSGGSSPSSINSSTVATFRRTGGLSHSCYISILGGSTGESSIFLGDRDSETAGGRLEYDHNSDVMKFTVTSTERMRITSSGTLLVSATTTSGLSNGTSNYGHSFGGGQQVNATNNDTNLILNMSNGSSNPHVQFRSDGGNTGSISTNGSAVAFNTGSDYRLKENVIPLKDGLNRVNKLKPVQFDWKKSQETDEGFIAHEAQEIIPYAVKGEKDGEEIQIMDYAKLTPLLVKAIQEQQAQIDELKAKLESK